MSTYIFATYDILMLLLSYFSKVHFKALVTDNSYTVVLSLKLTGQQDVTCT